MATTKRSTHRSPKKSTAKKTTHCWPGFTPVEGKRPGTKGSCKPKAHQTSSERKADSKAAAASRQRKSS